MGSGMETARVCEKCVIKKRKCNRQRPTCSRCLEDNVTCVYTLVKRKPGPAKGFKKTRQSGVTQHHNSLKASEITTQDAVSPSKGICQDKPDQTGVHMHEYDWSPSVSTASTSQLPATSVSHYSPVPSGTLDPFLFYAPSLTSSSASQGIEHLDPLYPQITWEQTHQMLESFFTYVHPSVCLFDKHRLMRDHKQGRVDDSLLVTILAITSHVQGLKALWTSPSLKSCLDQLLAIETFKVDHIGDMIPLARFQQAFLLAFYEFHQHPGRKSWLRVSELTREAYEWGLNQLDNPDQCQLYANNTIIDEEKEGWRRLWWSIYCLDSYCNITARTPFVIELDDVRTALISSDHTQLHQDPIFLPTDTDSLWETCQLVSARPGDYYINLHILTTTLLRKAGKLTRLWAQRPRSEADESHMILDEHLSAVRLALPRRFLDVSRDLVQNESPAEHHARLICILHMHMTRLLVLMPRDSVDDEEQWRRGWSASLECCEEVVMIVRQWKAQLCPTVDPAVCFIISGVVMILHLHSVDVLNIESAAFLARLRGQKELLQLFVEQFASIWHLPRFLAISCKKFAAVFPGPMTHTEIASVMAKMGGALLNQNWMRHLSLTSNHLKPPEVSEFDMVSDVDFCDQEFWAELSSITSIS